VRQARAKVVNAAGLHARPAAVFVAEAGKFASKIRVRNATTNSGWADAKSILSVLTLGVEPQHEIEFTAEGPDEEQAAAALAGLITSDFLGKL
jgi:phosphotransferase system HPr (HPr) family protein